MAFSGRKAAFLLLLDVSQLPDDERKELSIDPEDASWVTIPDSKPASSHGEHRRKNTQIQDYSDSINYVTLLTAKSNKIHMDF